MDTTFRRMPPLGLPASRGYGAEHAASLRLTQQIRAVWRATLMLLWTGAAALVQGVLILLPGRAKIVFARVYWATVCRAMGVQVRVIGDQARHPDGRPVVFASNHSSWLDVPVLGGTLEACFIAKEEVGRWPVIRTVARLGRTVFVSRRASNTGRERDSMRERLDGGDNLILFPEGTSSDGSRVLPFRSAFFSIVEERGAGLQPLIQPVSIVYDLLAGLPMGRASRPISSWYGSMDLGSHFWRLARYRRLRATVLLHTPIDPALFPTRKALSYAVWETVAEGAATLRQNRPVLPRPAPSAADHTAFA